MLTTTTPPPLSASLAPPQRVVGLTPVLQPSSQLAQHNESSTADSMGSPSCSGLEALLLAAQACQGRQEVGWPTASGSTCVATGRQRRTDAASAIAQAQCHLQASRPGGSQRGQLGRFEEAGAILPRLHRLLAALLQPPGEAIASRQAAASLLLHLQPVWCRRPAQGCLPRCGSACLCFAPRRHPGWYRP